MSEVRAVLWDADGVLQAGPASWADAFGEALGKRVVVAEEFFSILDDALAGRVDMETHVTEVLDRHGLTDRREQTLEVWGRIDPLAEVRDLVAELPVPSYLATNQDNLRAACMRRQLGYDELLAGAYYSCDLGLAKPDAAYFEAVLADLDLPAADVLFVDDSPANVDAARDVGLRAEVWHHEQGVDSLRSLLAGHGL